MVILFFLLNQYSIREQDIKNQKMDVCTLPLRTGSMVESLGEDNVSLVLLVGYLSPAQGLWMM